MDFITLAKKRYSVRTYQERPVEEEKLTAILQAGRIAPTAANKQPQRFVIVQKEEELEKLRKAAKIFNAPMAIIVCGDHNEVWVRPQDGKHTVDIDASIATDHMMLQATELGLGTLWVAWFDKKIIQQEFHLPEYLEPINILLLGSAAGESLSPERHQQTREPLEHFIVNRG